MACGKPVITTPIVGASGDIAASNAGIVVKPADAGALAEAIVYIASNPVKAREMGGNALRVSRERFSWKVYASVLMEEYRKAVP